MKKIDGLVIRSFIGPFILTFFLILFILLMQFVWKYLDDLMGKGLDFFVVMELLAYQSTNLVSSALPLAVLLASIMTMGSLAEHFELVALKASGLSLFKIMRGLIVFIMLIALGAFLFSNYVTPVANLKFKTLLFDIVQKKPLLEIKEGYFYNDLGQFVIRVEEKDENDRMYDVLIYDHRPPNRGNGNVIRAKEAEMAKTVSGSQLLFTLYDGTMYREMNTENHNKKYNHLKTKFEEMQLRMDLSGFEMGDTDEDRFSNNYGMMNMAQLKHTADSLGSVVSKRLDKVQDYMRTSVFIANDSLPYNQVEPLNFNDDFDKLPLDRREKIMMSARNLKGSVHSYVKVATKEVKGRKNYIIRFWNEWHRKLTLSFACIVLFFIGAPLGAIVKKGGLGLPVLISIVIFLIYFITSMSGEKMAKSAVMTPFMGMWLSTLVLAPFSAFLTIQAMQESSLFDMETYTKFFRRIVGKKG